jgi:hypothetical protein
MGCRALHDLISTASRIQGVLDELEEDPEVVSVALGKKLRTIG